ncbi:MAG TPA: DUF4055 domain-containing protein [Acetobacteraceae bacterium]|nr:DUF4055 domain-containing protein [Acetobacteraceae bacterium]
MPVTVLGKDSALPNYARPEFTRVAPDLKLIEDELGGTRAMHDASETYIRKWSDEETDNYKFRRTCETFFEGLGRTLSAAVGMLFAKPPAVEWNRSRQPVEAHWANIDAEGTAGHVFVKRFAEAALRDGLALLMVDHPPAPAGVVVTAANEDELNLRPTWAFYPRAAVINWQTEVIDNVRTLTLLVLYEPATERDGEFGIRTLHRYRVLRLVPVEQDGTIVARAAEWRLWEMRGDGVRTEDFVDMGSGTFRNRAGQVASRLPVAIGYTGRTDAPMVARPPLLGVAWANLSHWQLSTDLRFNTIVAGFAQPTLIGRLVSDDQTGAAPPRLKIGPLVLVNIEQGGDFRWTEAPGSGLKQLAELVLEKLNQIAHLGVSFLQRDTRAPETAEAKRLDAAAENATLATAAQGIEDAVNLGFELHAWYLGIDRAGAPVATLSRDYGDTALAADIMTAYVRGVADAGLPVRLLLEAWQQGGRIKADEDLEALEMEVMANQQAIADQKATEAAKEGDGR